ncbi:MAG: hypothetical protein ABIQ02_13850 [Saprospiraceae bacterium]
MLRLNTRLSLAGRSIRGGGANGYKTNEEIIEYYLAIGEKEFTRKDYMSVFKDISSATASRDLNKAIQLKKIIQSGTKNTTKYKIR